MTVNLENLQPQTSYGLDILSATEIFSLFSLDDVTMKVKGDFSL